MRSIQKQKESADDHRRQELIQEINEIKEKISQLDQLQGEIETIEELIKLEQSKSSKLSVSSYSAGKPKPESKSRLATNSNKKIKIYELNKKRDSRQKQYKDKHVGYLARLRKHEEQMIMISDTDQDIRKQRDNSNELDRLHASLLSDINRLQEKCNENSAMLSSERQVLTLYEKQKVKRIQEIKRLKKIINQSAQNTEPDDVAYSLNELEQYEAEDIKIKPLVFKHELISNNSPNLLSENGKEEQILIEDEDENEEQEISLVPAYISFKKSHKHRLTQSPPLISLNESKEHNCSKEIGKSYEQLETDVVELEEKIQKDRKLYERLIQSSSLVKRGNRNLEASAKHMIVTLDLLKNRLENVTRINEEESKELVENIEKYNSLYCKLMAREGERGELRGRLGIKVENTRMLGIINEQISLDLHKLSDAVPRLKIISGECLELVKRLTGAGFMNENLNDY